MASVFALSIAGFSFQVALTRVFSLVFHYHYVFLAVSLATLGLGLGALVAHVLRRLRGASESATWSDLGGIALGLVVVFPLLAWFLSRLSSPSLVAACLLGLVPFVLIGTFYSRVFSSFPEHSAAMYGADLAGAGAGLLAVVGLLAWGGAFQVILVLSVPPALALLAVGAVVGHRGLVVASLVGLLVACVLSIGNHRGKWLDLTLAEIEEAPAQKTMIHLLRDPEQSARITATRWTPFSRVDVVETDDPSRRYVFVDGGAGSTMYARDGDLQEHRGLRGRIDYLPFALGPCDRVLVLGVGAGRDVLLAELAGSEEVVAVEINPATVELTREMGAYNGNVLDRPGVETVVADGRTWVERDDRDYDLVYLNTVYSQAAAPGTSALSENYIFTVEALRAYWRHLRPAGRLGIVTHNATEGLRVLRTAVRALEEEGYTEAEALRRIVFVRTKRGPSSSWGAAVVVRREPWTRAAARGLLETVRSLGFQEMYVPLVSEKLPNGMDLDEFVASQDHQDYTPTTDDRPFFYHLQRKSPAALRDLLLWTIAAAVVFAAIVLFRRGARRGVRVLFLAYFGLLGTAFMLAEMPLIQRFILLLGNPTLSLVAVIGGLLFGAGLGSFASGRFRAARLPRSTALVALAVAVALVVSMFVYPLLIDALLPATSAVRALGTIGMLLPLGFVMGMPFPCGVRLAGAADAGGVAVYWGVNAVTSVLGSVLAILLALSFGFQLTMWLGVTLYLTAAAVAGLGLRRVT